MPYKNIKDRRNYSRRIIKEGYYKIYYQNNKERYRLSEKKDMKKRLLRVKKYLKTNIVLKKKIRARELARQNISLKDKVCTKCGSKENLHRHHEDYNKPLEVIILCKECHKKIHILHGNQGGNNLGASNVNF